MSRKIATETIAKPPPGVVEDMAAVREYDEERDKVAVEELERQCEFGQPGKATLVTDLMGDPICRVRHFPSHVMLVAEYGEEKEIVGAIRACVKTVTRGKKESSDCPDYVKLAYILGLRVLPMHRRLGIGKKLVGHVEEWCKQNGAEYAYIATDSSNEASIKLFTLNCKYVKFRTPAILVQPVHAHYKLLGSGVAVITLPPQLAESVYRRVFANSEFFPEDLGRILNNKLNLGTFMAMPKKSLSSWDPKTGSLPTCSYAIMSVWNAKEVCEFQVKGVSALKYACSVGSRVLDKLMPWLRIPSIPNVFEPFGIYFLYGLHMEGKDASHLMKSLCAFAHNMARDAVGCAALVAQVGPLDSVREAVTHWKMFSWDEDIWCIKKLNQEANVMETSGLSDCIEFRSVSEVMFFDPRDF